MSPELHAKFAHWASRPRLLLGIIFILCIDAENLLSKILSTNGTYVKEDGADIIYLRREEMPLRGSGIICMGESPKEAGHIVHFKCAAAKQKS